MVVVQFSSPFHVLLCVALAVTAVFQDNNCQTRLIILGGEGRVLKYQWGERMTDVMNGTVMEKLLLKAPNMFNELNRNKKGKVRRES